MQKKLLFLIFFNYDKKKFNIIERQALRHSFRLFACITVAYFHLISYYHFKIEYLFLYVNYSRFAGNHYLLISAARCQDDGWLPLAGWNGASYWLDWLMTLGATTAAEMFQITFLVINILDYVFICDCRETVVLAGDLWFHYNLRTKGRKLLVKFKNYKKCELLIKWLHQWFPVNIPSFASV